MRRYRSIIVFALSLSLVLCFFRSGYAAATGDDMISASQAVSDIKVGWNLGNTLDAYGTWVTGNDPASYETCWGNPVTTRAMIDSVKAQGFNAVRIPVTWSQHIDSNGNVDRAWMDRVREVVDYAIEDDLYVILNVHHDTGEHGGDKVCWLIADPDSFSENENKYRGLWTSIATDFKDYGGKLMFEGYNEILDINNTWNAPSAPGAIDTVNRMAQVFVDTVRATGGNNATRNLIVNTYVSSVDQSVLDGFVLPSDRTSGHLICEVHVYAPWGFTGTAASVTWTPVHSDFGEADINEIRNIMNTLDSFSKRIGVPVIIGECGAEFKGNDGEIAKYASCLLDEASSKGIKIFWWDNGDFRTSGEGGYAIFNRNTMTWKEGIVSSLTGGAVTSDPTSTPSPTTAPTPSPEPTATPVPTSAPSESTSDTTPPSETTVTEETVITTETSVPEEQTVMTEDDGDVKESSSSGGEGLTKTTWIIIGAAFAVFVISLYTGLFLLGLSRRKSRR